MSARWREPVFFDHGGARMLRLEFPAGLAHRELLAAFDRAGAVVRAAPPASLRILTVLGARFNAESAAAMKRFALANKPHVRASAVVAPGAFWRVVVTGLQVEGREDMTLFDGEAEARDWLATR